MIASKIAFQRNKELAEWWATVSRNPDFDSVLIHARSAMMESGVTFEQMQGANRLLAILLGLCEADAPPEPLPTPGLVHEVSALISKVRAPK